MRPRPRADKGVSRTNASSISGGLFGREPSAYRYSPEGGDFLSRVEQAEARDADRRRNPSGAFGCNDHAINYGCGSAPTVDYTLSTLEEQQQMRERNRQKSQGGSIFIGDDTTHLHRRSPGDMYTTTKAQDQLKMQQSYQSALTRHQERMLIQIMVEQHGLSEAEAKSEIELYHKEEAEAQRQAAQPGRTRAKQPFAQPPPPQQPAFHPPQQPAFHPQQQPAFHPQQQPLQPPQPQPYEPSPYAREPPPFVHAASEEPPSFPPRRAPSPSKHVNSPNDVAAGAPRSVTAVHAGVVKERSLPQRCTANTSSTAGGIFAAGVWS